jgi:hypothetical protein
LPGRVIVKSFMKNGITYETTEAAEKNSVSSKRPSYQRDQRRTGCMKEISQGQSYYLAEKGRGKEVKD